MRSNQNNHSCSYSKALFASLVAGLFTPAYGQEIDAERSEAIATLTHVGSQINIGAGFISDDNRRFGQYSGLREESLYGKFDVDYRMLDRTDGRWLKFYGRNLGQDNREFLFDHQRQAEWRYFLGFSQTPRFEPMQIITGLQGIGTTTEIVSLSGLRPVDLKMKRELFSAGFDYAIGKYDSVRVRYTHEQKEGARIFGRGNPGGPAGIEFLAEPIDRTTQTLELSLSHIDRDFQVSGGYYGTLFTNTASQLAVSGGALGATLSPMSLPLSNDSHQVFITAGYNLTPLTRANFKTSYTSAHQNERFPITPSLALAPRSLDGQVDTTIVYADLTSMEIRGVDLQANIRYEDRDDKTPAAQYLSLLNANATNAGHTGFNKPRSSQSLKSKLEGGYQLPLGFKGLLTWEMDEQKLDAPELFRRVAYREELDEITTRIELKRIIAESATGAISFSHAKRTGSDYIPDTYTVSGQPSGDVNPLLWADRDRDTWRATLDWSPLDELNLRFAVDKSDDAYNGRDMGPRDGVRGYYAVDTSYSLSNRWKATFFVSREDTTAKQTTHTGAGPTQQWAADLRHIGDAYGFGVHGKMRNGVEMGADLNYYRETAQNRMSAVSSGFAVTSLPDYTYRLTEMKLFALFPLESNESMRFDYVFNDWRTDDWTWSGWNYSDGTTIRQDVVQKTHYIGGMYIYRWQ